VFIKATEDKSAEMVTDEGAIYVTSNRGYNWKAAIQETVSATLNRFVTLSLVYTRELALSFPSRFNRDQRVDLNSVFPMVLQNSIQWNQWC